MVELMLVIVMAGILMTMAVPKSSTTLENAQVNQGAAELQSLWLAQRRYRMEYGSFAPSLKALVQEGFVQERILEKEDPFRYSILVRGNGKMRISAERSGAGSWSGTLTLDEMGNLDGEVIDSGGRRVSP